MVGEGGGEPVADHQPLPPVTSRCAWPRTELDIEYHDTEWGVPVHDDRTHFEFLILEGAQAGLSWSTILKKRDDYRKAFADFDPARVARFTDKRVDEAARGSRHRPQQTQGQQRRHEREGVPRSAEGIRHLRHVRLALRERRADRRRTEDARRHPATHCRIRRAQQGPARAAASSSSARRSATRTCRRSGMVNDHTVDCFRAKAPLTSRHAAR